MVTIPSIRAFSLSFPEVTEQPHFEKASFRIKKKIFLTIDQKNKRVCVKLSPIDQNVFCTIHPSLIYPATGTWGKQGWTYAELKGINETVFKDLITTAYCQVAPKKLSEKFNRQ